MHSSAVLFGPDAVTHHQFLIQELAEGSVLAQHTKLRAGLQGPGVCSDSAITARISPDQLLST